MNHSINYSGFVEMFLSSSDEYEPYGCEAVPVVAGEGHYKSHNMNACAQESAAGQRSGYSKE